MSTIQSARAVPMKLSGNLQAKFNRLTPRQQAAVSAYRDALNNGDTWIDAVCAAVDAADAADER